MIEEIVEKVHGEEGPEVRLWVEGNLALQEYWKAPWSKCPKWRKGAWYVLVVKSYKGWMGVLEVSGPRKDLLALLPRFARLFPWEKALSLDTCGDLAQEIKGTSLLEVWKPYKTGKTNTPPHAREAAEALSILERDRGLAPLPASTPADPAPWDPGEARGFVRNLQDKIFMLEGMVHQEPYNIPEILKRAQVLLKVAQGMVNMAKASSSGSK